MLEARLFGPLRVEVDGRAVPEISGLRPRAVFAWLLLHPGRHARARVASRFWPDVLDTSARASLRNVLWTIRTALDTVGGARYLETGRESVGIAEDLPRRVDTAEFEQMAALDDPAMLESCFALAAEPLLADLADDWVLDARDEYRERIAGVALRLAEGAARRGGSREASAWARSALAQVPFRESVHRTLMRYLASAGENAEALAAYERCRAVLSAEFDTVPSEETRALADRLREETRAPQRPEPGASAEARPEPPLVGRGDEIADMAAVWERARGGQGGVLLLTGGAGLGKTRLVGELGARAAAQGARRGTGSVFELTGAPPFGPWSEALRDLVVDVPAPPVHVAWPADLARLCRSVEWRWERPASGPAPTPEQERSWLFEAVVEALAWCVRDRPLLLVLEDVHLADQATIALFTYVGRQLAHLPALLVATRRPGTVRQDLELAVDALARRGAVRAEITLEPLPAAETARIVTDTSPGLSPQTRARVVAAAEGNPLLAREAARASAAGQDLSQGLRAWLRAPLARLPEHARLLVDTVAAAGRPMGLGEAAELTGAGSLTGAVAAARQEDLLEVRELKVRFAHPLVLQACYAELEPTRRAWLHGRIADTLQARPGRSAAEIARHLLSAGRPDEAQGYLVSAARKARVLGAPEEAVRLLREAVALVSDTGPASAEIWLALAEAEARRGSREEYDDAFAQARSLLEAAEDPAALAAAYVARGRCLRTTLCFPGEALTASERALEIIGDAEIDAPELRALALANCAWVEAASGDAKRGEELATATGALSETAADPALAAELALTRGAALLRSRGFAEAEEISAHASRLLRRAGRPESADSGLLQTAAAAAARGATGRALELADRVLRGRCSTVLRAEALAVRAYGLSRMGRHDEACAVAQEKTALLARVDGAPQQATAVYDAGSLALAAGRHAEAVAHLSAALASESARFPRALARLRLAEARVRTGSPEGAEEELARFPFEPVGPADLPEALVPHLERVEAIVAAARAKNELSRRRFASAEAGWRRLFAAAPHGDPYAASLVVLGRWGPEGMVEPGVELGRTLADHALLLARDGAADEAATAAEEAAVLAERLAYDGYQGTLCQVREMRK